MLPRAHSVLEVVISPLKSISWTFLRIRPENAENMQRQQRSISYQVDIITVWLDIHRSLSRYSKLDSETRRCHFVAPGGASRALNLQAFAHTRDYSRTLDLLCMGTSWNHTNHRIYPKAIESLNRLGVAKLMLSSHGGNSMWEARDGCS
jgi:hypothetical protein